MSGSRRLLGLLLAILAAILLFTVLYRATPITAGKPAACSLPTPE